MLSQELSLNSISQHEDLEEIKLETEENVVDTEKEVLQKETRIDEEIELANREEVLVDEVPVSLPTKVIQANNLAENYNTIYKDIKIKNETSFNLSQEILNPNIDFSNKTDIIIFHTHTCESYTQTKENVYRASRKLSNN